MDKLEMVEKYNKDGVCISRTINGFELPTDTEPSVQIFKNLESVTQNFYMTPREAQERFNYSPNTQ